MGQRNTRSSYRPSNFDPSEWYHESAVPNDPAAQQYGRMRTLKNRSTEELIDKYDDTLMSQKEYDDYLLSYEWRRAESNIVKAHHLQTRNGSRYCSTTYNVSIYIEHPKNRLSDFSDIPFPDTMYCLTAMLIGYNKLFQHVGSFPVKEEQVCIDEKGQVRVWFNKDLSKNYPEEWEIEPTTRSIDEDEEEMVSQIVSVVARNSDSELEPNPTFIEFYENKRAHRRIGFDEALLLVDEYTQNNNQTVPEYFTSVVEVYEHQEGLYENDGQEGTNVSSFQGNEEVIEDDIQREIQRRNQLFHGSQADRKTVNNSIKSRASRASQIDNLDKYNRPIQNEMLGKLNISNHSKRSSRNNQNRNQGQTYRLSGLDDNDKVVTTYQPLKNYNPSSNVNPNVYRPSEAMSNPNNFSQISYNNALLKTSQPTVWVSLKPQQPYIPSSPTYINIQGGEQAGLLTQLNNAHTVRTQNTQREQNSRHRIMNNNYSISEKQEENASNIGGEDYMNQKFERELEEEILKDHYEVEAKEPKYKPLPQREHSRQMSHNLEVAQNLNKTGSQNSMRGSSRQNEGPKTAQFIIQNSNHQMSNAHSNSSSNLPSISKSNSAQGFTIVIRSPSQQRVANYEPQSPQHMTQYGSPSQVRMVKNNSQPFLPASPAYPMNFPSIAQFPLQNLSQFAINQSVPMPYAPAPSPNPVPVPISPVSPSSSTRSNKKVKEIETSYCTVKEEIPLDPEIINDMMLYI